VSVKRELRVVASGVKRAADGDKPAIEGYAATFNSPTEIGGMFGGFREVIMPGAFVRSLNAGADVRCLWNHDPNVILGRTKSKTLVLKEDAKGLFFRCELPNTQAARDLYESISRGDVDSCSFGFQAVKQNWLETKSDDPSALPTRELLDVELFDAGPVTFPAYNQTSVDARNLWPDGMPDEVRSHLRYSEDQPRDEHGKFASGGGEGSGSGKEDSGASGLTANTASAIGEKAGKDAADKWKGGDWKHQQISNGNLPASPSKQDIEDAKYSDAANTLNGLADAHGLDPASSSQHEELVGAMVESFCEKSGLSDIGRLADEMHDAHNPMGVGRSHERSGGEHRMKCSCRCESCSTDGKCSGCTGENCSSFCCAADGCTIQKRSADNATDARDRNCQCDCDECVDGNCIDCTDPECDDPNCDGHERAAQPYEPTEIFESSEVAAIRCSCGWDVPAAVISVNRAAFEGHAEMRHAGAERRAASQAWKVDGEELSLKAFAYRAADKPKLPIAFSTEEKTKAHIRNAIARYNQTKMPDAEEKAKAWGRITAAAKENGIKVSESNSKKWNLTQEQRDELREARVAEWGPANDPDNDGDDDSAILEAMRTAVSSCEHVSELLETAIEDYDEESLTAAQTECRKAVAVLEKAATVIGTELAEGRSATAAPETSCVILQMRARAVAATLE